MGWREESRREWGRPTHTVASSTLAAALALVFLLAAVLVLPLTPGLRWPREAQRETARPHPVAGTGARFGPVFPRAAVLAAESLMAAQVRKRVYPGASVAAGIGGRMLLLKGVGRLEWDTASPPVSAESTMYDLASLSKAVATTTAVLLLVQDGRIRLDDPVQWWLPEFWGRWKNQVTWRDLLTHTSGLPPAGHMSGDYPGDRLASLMRTRLNTPPGTEVEYSDVGYIVLWVAARRAAGMPLPAFLRERVWRPLGMTSTGYLPGMDCEECAPTLSLRDGTLFRGKPSDPAARKLGGIAGNAGLFSTAADLARYAAMIANGGELDGVRILRPELVRELFTQQPHAGRRTLGWDAFCPEEPAKTQIVCARPVAFGHYGWTGTSLWVDPRRRLWVVLLANRSFNVPKPKSMDTVREGVFATLARALPPAGGAAAAGGAATRAGAPERTPDTATARTTATLPPAPFPGAERQRGR